MNLKSVEFKRKINRLINKILIKILDVIFHPLRMGYKKYEKSDLFKKNLLKKHIKKMYNKIYYTIAQDGYLYLVDFWLNHDDRDNDVISTRDFYIPKHYKNLTDQQLLLQIIEKLKQDKQLNIEQVSFKQVFKYSYNYNEEVKKNSLIYKVEKVKN